MSDLELGKKVLKAFYNYSVIYFPKNYVFSFDTFLAKYQKDPKKLNIILDGIGGGVRESGISDSKINDAMSKLALSSQGKMPSDYQVFFKYLTGEAVKINWIDAAGYVALNSAKDVIKGTAAVGDSIISAGSFLNKILPILLVGGVLILAFSWLNRTTGGDAGKMFKAFKK